MGFDFTVEFRPGRNNVVADALSRRDEDMAPTLMALIGPAFSVFDDLRREVATDSSLVALRDKIAADELGAPWAFTDGLLTKQGRVFVAARSPSLPALLDVAHTGHEGVERTLHRLCADFTVPNTKQVVQDHVHACTICQRNKVEHLHPAGLLQPLPVPTRVWEDISMDFEEGLPRVNGKSVILTVVDRQSKYAHFLPLGHPYTATSVAHVFFNEVVRRSCLLQRGGSPPRHTALHRQRQRPRLHQRVLDGTVSPCRGQAHHELGVSPSEGRPIGGGQPGDRHVPALPDGRSPSLMDAMATVGGILLQHGVSIIPPHDAVSGGLWLAAARLARL